MDMNNAWTIAYRKPTANRFQRVTNWTGSWHEAVEMAGLIAEAHPELQVYYVTTAAHEAWEKTQVLGEQWNVDHGNILVDSGKRVRMVDTGAIDADELATWSAAATDAAEAKLIEGYIAAMAKGEPAGDAEAAAYRRAVDRANYEAEAQPTPEQEDAAAGYYPSEAEIDAGVARWEATRAAEALAAAAVPDGGRI